MPEPHFLMFTKSQVCMLVMSHDQALLQERRETTEKALTFLYPFQWFQAGTVLRKDTENLQVDTPHRVHVDMSRANAVLHGPPLAQGTPH